MAAPSYGYNAGHGIAPPAYAPPPAPSHYGGSAPAYDTQHAAAPRYEQRYEEVRSPSHSGHAHNPAPSQAPHDTHARPHAVPSVPYDPYAHVRHAPAQSEPEGDARHRSRDYAYAKRFEQAPVPAQPDHCRSQNAHVYDHYTHPHAQLAHGYGHAPPPAPSAHSHGHPPPSVPHDYSHAPPPAAPAPAPQYHGHPPTPPHAPGSERPPPQAPAANRYEHPPPPAPATHSYEHHLPPAPTGHGHGYPPQGPTQASCGHQSWQAAAAHSYGNPLPPVPAAHGHGMLPPPAPAAPGYGHPPPPAAHGHGHAAASPPPPLHHPGYAAPPPPPAHYGAPPAYHAPGGKRACKFLHIDAAPQPPVRSYGYDRGMPPVHGQPQLQDAAPIGRGAGKKGKSKGKGREGRGKATKRKEISPAVSASEKEEGEQGNVDAAEERSCCSESSSDAAESEQDPLSGKRERRGVRKGDKDYDRELAKKISREKEEAAKQAREANPEATREELPLELLKDRTSRPDAFEEAIASEHLRSWMYLGHEPSVTHDDFKLIFDNVNWLDLEVPTAAGVRRTMWFTRSPCTCPYSYGMERVPPTPIPAWFDAMAQRWLALFHFDWANGTWSSPSRPPDAVNLNLYENGLQGLGWHSDDEALFCGKTQDTRIISVSLGCNRQFRVGLRAPRRGGILKPEAGSMRCFTLKHGSICTMEGLFQKHYIHQVPKCRKGKKRKGNSGSVNTTRINATFRWITCHGVGCPCGMRAIGN
eukprot:TRINITY_DN18259_c0_g1_i2.p1 TRINITY_DN18259_c0_g1~~TRINITY_DN18259_c0_g1_i2.p1  ORF type:complete len:751 (+),score=98.32 TRINITY_DN18259_c0_g1_i2:91-2343(+)